jgi:hypothetical protein
MPSQRHAFIKVVDRWLGGVFRHGNQRGGVQLSRQALNFQHPIRSDITTAFPLSASRLSQLLRRVGSANAVISLHCLNHLLGF